MPVRSNRRPATAKATDPAHQGTAPAPTSPGAAGHASQQAAPRSSAGQACPRPRGWPARTNVRIPRRAAIAASSSARRVLPIPASPTSPTVLVAHRRGGGAASIDDTEGASDERAGDPALAGSGAGYAKSVSRRRPTGCCIGLIDQARPWGVRRRRAQLRIAMSRPRARRGVFARSSFGFCSPELAGLPNSFCVKVTAQGTDTTLWK